MNHKNKIEKCSVCEEFKEDFTHEMSGECVCNECLDSLIDEDDYEELNFD